MAETKLWHSCVMLVPETFVFTQNIIIGHPIPAASGIYRYAEIDIQPPAGYEAPPPRAEGPVSQQLGAALVGDEE